MSYPRHEAPKSLVSFVWSIAAMLGFFLAIALSSFFVLKHYYPVDASNSANSATPLPTKGDCKNEGDTKVAIHNYPGISPITEAYPNESYQHGQVEKALGDDFRCSMLCVPGLDQKKQIQDPANLSVIQSYLSGATAGGKPMKFAKDGTEFVSLVKSAIEEKDSAKKDEQLAELKRVAILPYSKNACVGYAQGSGGSIDYDKIEVKGKELPKEEENKTKKKADLAKEQQKAATEKAKALLDAPKTGPQVAVNNSAPLKDEGAGGATIANPAESKGGAEPKAQDLDGCKTKINNFLIKYENLLNQVPTSQVQPDPDITRYKEIRDAYKKLKDDQNSTLKRCQEIEKSVDKMSDKLWGTKTVLAKCKKNMNDFLANYPRRTDLNDTLRGLRYDVSSRQYYIKYSPFYWVSAERQLASCKIAQERIKKYLAGVNDKKGVFVNGVPWRCARIDKDKKTLGKYKWMYRYASDYDSPSWIDPNNPDVVYQETIINSFSDNPSKDCGKTPTVTPKDAFIDPDQVSKPGPATLETPLLTKAQEDAALGKTSTTAGSVPAKQSAAEKAKLEAESRAKLAAMTNRTLTYRLSGKVYFDQKANNLSQNTTVCVATDWKKDGIGGGAGTFKRARFRNNNGNFQIDLDFGSNELPTGLHIIVYDIGLFRTGVYTYNYDTVSFNSLFLKAAEASPPEYTVSQSYIYDLRKGDGNLRAALNSFRSKTGRSCR